MCEFYFLIFLAIMVLGLLSSLVYLNFEIVLIIVILIVLYSFFCTDSNNNNNKQDIIENAKEILVGFYKINDKSHIKTVELYFKNNGTCDILYENIYNDYWYNTEYQKKYQRQEINDMNPVSWT